MANRVLNFGAGPSALPLSVLEEAQKGLLDFEGTGIGIAEISHRSKEFVQYLSEISSHIREQLEVPTTHEILFTQGGGTGQFSAVVLNMLARHRLLNPDADEERIMDYVITGSWSKKAADEARRLGGGTVNVVVDSRTKSKDGKSFDNIPSHHDFNFSDAPALIYYCDNETVDGVQFSHEEGSAEAFPYHLIPTDTLPTLVGDHSSSFMSRQIPHLAQHAIIYAGAQKNLGPAGLTILIVRRDCLVDVDAAAKLGAVPTPITMSYKSIFDQKSLYNTPSVFALYVTGLVLRRMKELGGVRAYEGTNRRKQEKLYAVLAEGEQTGVFKRKVKDGSGSWMNVVFDVVGEGREALFIEGATQRGMKGIQGHRSVGGIRVSLYNAITDDDTDRFVTYVHEFIGEHGDYSK